MDGAGFMEKEGWLKLLEITGRTNLDLRDNRYDAVIHMVTAADGCPEFYDYENSARYHSPEQAVETDKMLRTVYLGHNKLFVIGNEEPHNGFDGKIERTVEAVKTVLGLPTQKTCHKKFLVDTSMVDINIFQNIVEEETNDTHMSIF